MPADVFVNNDLNLSDIKVYGFDYDFTLARYNNEVQRIIYDFCLDYLVKEKQVSPYSVFFLMSIYIPLVPSWLL